MSTPALIAAKNENLSRFGTKSPTLPGTMTRVFARALLQKVLCLGSDILALTLAHMLASSLGERLLDIPFSVLNSFEYQRYDIPFFTVILYLFEGYKSLETRRPEQELERTSKAVVVGFVGLILFNFVSFRSQASRGTAGVLVFLALRTLARPAVHVAGFLCALVEGGMVPPPRTAGRFRRRNGGVSATPFHSAAQWLRVYRHLVGLGGCRRFALDGAAFPCSVRWRSGNKPQWRPARRSWWWLLRRSPEGRTGWGNCFTAARNGAWMWSSIRASSRRRT